jgi:hypothetical protein
VFLCYLCQTPEYVVILWGVYTKHWLACCRSQ